MKNQDKDIYRQLMALNSNIKRLKNEIAGEEEKRQQKYTNKWQWYVRKSKWGRAADN